MLFASRCLGRRLVPEELVVAVGKLDRVGLPVPLVVRGTPGLLHRRPTARRCPPFDPPPTGGVRIEVEPVDVEDADVWLVLANGLGLAWLFMDLHRAVEPRSVVVIAAARGGCGARSGEYQESQTSDEGQDPGRLAHWCLLC